MAEKRVKIDPEKIHLLGVKIIKGNIDVDDEFDESELSSFSVDFDTKEGFIIGEKIVRLMFSASIVGVDKENKKLPLSADFTFEFIFRVDNLDDYIEALDGEKKSVSVHSILGHNLIAIVYSTARGIILTRTQGTVVKDGILLPVIDTSTLLKRT